MAAVPLISEGTLAGGVKLFCVLFISAFSLYWPRGSLVTLAIFLGMASFGTLLLVLPMDLTGQFHTPIWIYGWIALDAIGVILVIRGLRSL